MRKVERRVGGYAVCVVELSLGQPKLLKFLPGISFDVWHMPRGIDQQDISAGLELFEGFLWTNKEGSHDGGLLARKGANEWA